MRVRVVIPVYNQAAYVAEAIESALGQSCAAARVVVVDDGSTDGTGEVCERYLPRIEYVRQPNSGVSAARNRGMEALAEDAVLFLDSDDVLDPEWLGRAVERCAAAQAGGSRVGFVYGDHVLFEDGGAYEKTIRIETIDVEGLLRDSLLIPSGTLATRACLEAVGPFDGRVNTCEDWDYWLRAALQGFEFLHVEGVAFRHREHGESASKREASALEARERFLRLWLDGDTLALERKAVMRAELARTLLRLRRAAFYRGAPTGDYVRRALETDPSAVGDPWSFVYGAVYAAPFFRRDHDRAAVRRSVEAMEGEVVAHLRGAGRLDGRTLRRVRAGSALALAANDFADRRRVSAGGHLLRAVGRDPSLLVDALRRSLGSGEIRRAKGIV
ncbi:MAG: glycosyltransferase [Gemmatimonadota bacterium]